MRSRVILIHTYIHYTRYRYVLKNVCEVLRSARGHARIMLSSSIRACATDSFEKFVFSLIQQ
jgi:hypothetical protein